MSESATRISDGAVSVEKIPYGGWPNCYRISNDKIELVVTTDVGPRIIRLGFPGGPNFFVESEDQLGRTGDDRWLNYGGHRLWHAPEQKPRTYFPDNFPVRLETNNDFVRLIQPVETTTGIIKELDLRLAPGEAKAEVTHRLRHSGTPATPLHIAPWALSMMAPGGTAIVPLPPRRSHEEELLPLSRIALWGYTDMTDPRWTWGKRYVLLRQDPSRDDPQKAGFSVPDGWIAYVNDGGLLIKKFDFEPEGDYPDLGVNTEIFTNGGMLEVETLAVLSQMKAGDAVEHTEHWAIYDSVKTPRDDAEVEALVLPFVDR